MIPLNFANSDLAVGTTSKSYTLPFTPTTGSLLVAVVTAPATATTPTGWTLSGSTVSSYGAYLFTKVSDGTETSINWTQNGARVASIAVWEYENAVIGVNTGFFSYNATSNSLPVTGSGSYITIRCGTGPTAPTTTWTGDGSEVVDLQPVSAADGNTVTWLSVYQMDHSTGTTLDWSFNLNSDALNLHIVPKPTAGTTTLLAEYSGGPSNSHTITLTTPSAAGTDLIVFGISTATVTLPSTWVADYNGLATDHSFVFRLPGASNPGLTSVTFSQSASVPLTAVVVEDNVQAVAYSNFGTSSGATVSGGTLMGSGLHTYSLQDVAFAVFWRQKDAGTFNASVGQSADQGFAIVGQKTLAVGAAAGAFLVVAGKSSSSFSDNGVTLTINPGFDTSTGMIGSSRPGIIAYQRRVPDEDTTAPSVTSRNPASGAINVAISAPVVVGFNEPLTAVSITMNQAGTNVPGTVTGSGATRTFTPSSTLTANTVYTVVVSGASDAASNTQVGSDTWSFTTATPGTPTTHSVWGSTVPPGTYSLFTDGTPTIEYGNGYYRAGSGTGWYADMRIIGGRLFKPTAITLPSGDVTIRAYTNTGGAPRTGTTLTGFGTLAGTKTVATSTLVNGWNDILFDTPITMAPNGGVVFITSQFSVAGNYLYNGAARAINDSQIATDGTKLYWSETTAIDGYFSAVWKIGSTYGIPAPNSHTISYATDILTDEGAAADTTPPTVTSRTPSSGATNIATSTVVTVGFSEVISSVTITMNRSGTNVPGTVTGTGNTRVFTPTAALDSSTTYTVVVSGATDPSSNTQVGSDTWSFSTVAAGGYSFGSTIAEEIALPGTSAGFMSISGAGDSLNQGFARQMSTNAGSTVQFSVSGDCQQIDIFRVGGYDTGWRKVGQLVNTPTTQPAAATITNSNGATTCEAWSVTASWAIPSGAWSGLYVALVRNAALNNGSWIPFIVRNDSRTADVVVKTSDSTWGMAYNYYGTQSSVFGGACLYGIGGIGDITQRSFAVSLDRPIVTRQSIEQTYWTNAEMPLWRFLDKQGINWKMITSGDLDEGLTRMTGAKVLVSSGHDEYWSTEMRDNAEAFRDAGGHLIFWSGNEVFWRIRYSTDRRTAWCYKDTMTGPASHVAGTPLDPVTWTGTWKDTRWAGRKPENTITGTDFRMNGVVDFDATINAATYGSSPFWRNTSVATGTNLTLARVIGFEADIMAPTQTNTVNLGTTTVNIDGRYADNNGENYSGNGNLTWGIVLQKYASGGVVVGFGTVQWQWALDGVHARGDTTVSVQAQQATLNLLTDMGAPPANPTGGLVVPTQRPWSAYGVGHPTLSDSLAVFAGVGEALKVYAGNVLIWEAAEEPPVEPSAGRLIAEYHGASSTTHTVPLTTTVPGKSLLAIAHAPALITMPAGWTETRLDLSSTHLGVWRLNPGSHTAALTSLSVTLNAARQLAIVVVEDDMNNFYLGNTTGGGSRLTDSTYSTGSHTISRDAGLAFYAASDGGGNVTAAVGGYNNGFTAFADTGSSTGGSGNESVRTYVAGNTDIALSSGSVTLTTASALPGLDLMFGGIIAWNQVPAVVGVNLFSGTPTYSLDTGGEPISLGTEFSVVAAANLTKIRFFQPTGGTNANPRQCALYSVNSGGLTGTMVAGPFTMGTPIAGAWCEYTLTTPYALTVNQRYRAVVYHPDGYFAATANYFTSGLGTPSVTIEDILYRPDVSQALGNRQGTFNYATGIAFPSGVFNGGNYYSDVEVVPG